MKKILLTIMPLLAAFSSFAQFQSPVSGITWTPDRVGIGTNTPWTTFSVFQANNNNTYISAGNNTISTFMGAGGALWGIVGTASNHDFALYTGNTEKMRIANNGNVGIGTSNPLTTLYLQNANTSYSATLTLKNTANNFAARAGLTLENDAGNQTQFYKQASGSFDANDAILYSAQGDTRIYTGGGERFRITSSGKVGIGTTVPDQKLTVNGTIHATEVLVDQTVQTPDYVFDKDYDLATLKDVKTYIDQNHHLPEIPSAAEITKEGINLGEMNAKLLKKIEELTLYLIEKDKKQEGLETMVLKQNKVIRSQQKYDVLITKKLHQIQSQIKCVN
ncbi:tail fiber protein [Mucilaginibacter jinjuensis]|uniref:Tail fiber protein n=1 Tax=Mucilaginibacter jinjuensis TaxID=1176721 RepID=A0ABY7TDD3_9SPHI|nr:tail fiber protein [Mucilaginibacter jinjuensis]WCT13632.1 tail fiber protein [Mucilaginibacter jinjuensis]